MELDSVKPAQVLTALLRRLSAFNFSSDCDCKPDSLRADVPIIKIREAMIIAIPSHNFVATRRFFKFMIIPIGNDFQFMRNAPGIGC
jgi:hypothetical protein